MRRARKADLVVILVFVALLIPFSAHLSKSSLLPQNNGSHIVGADAPVPPATLRWSTTGGCYAHSYFYFELRTDEKGANCAGESPDYPLESPEPQWLQNDRFSLFARYPES